ncbi:MAG: MerR family transcriptional regulator, copper efflux regulator, partial [Solirubrobacteraceae bacterium]|nr:MerR family transcriptional regulator, copper efflux regulator [Solirubrobacteraceae bacterium]
CAGANLAALGTLTEGGFRLYTDEQADRLLLIKQMKPLGFTVAEMRDLLEARDAIAGAAAGTDPAAAHERLAAFATDAAARVEDLRRQLTLAEEFCASLEAAARGR